MWYSMDYSQAYHFYPFLTDSYHKIHLVTSHPIQKPSYLHPNQKIEQALITSEM